MKLPISDLAGVLMRRGALRVLAFALLLPERITANEHPASCCLRLAGRSREALGLDNESD